MKTYLDLINSLSKMGELEFIGSTVLGYGIPLVHIGHDQPSTLIIGSVHAREYITTLLLSKLIAKVENCCFDYLPMLNIDGVMLCQNGLDFVSDIHRKNALLRYNGNNHDFSLWKANINGVDLNVNFDADWGEGKSNITYPWSENYIGRFAHSEPETKAVVKLLAKNKYSLVACYHSKGEVVYWGFESNFRHYLEAKAIADKLGYTLERSEGSAGGIKDYYCSKYLGLGVTIEVGKDSLPHPYPVSELPKLVKQHTGSIELLCGLGGKIARKLYGGGTQGSSASI